MGRGVLTLVVAAILLGACGGSSSGGDVSSASTRPSTRQEATTEQSGSNSSSTVESSTTTPPHMVNRVVLIDPGHNGANGSHPDEINRPVDIVTQERGCDTTGTATDAGYTESEYNLDIALVAASLLREKGATVVLTRTDNEGVGPCIDERAAIGNRAGAVVAISIHADGGPADGRGFHVIEPASISGYTDGIFAESHRLALDVRSAYQSATGMPFATYLAIDGLDQRSDLGGLNLSRIPKVFIETGNMRNATDAALLSDPAFRARAAQGIVDGIAAYLAGG